MIRGRLVKAIENGADAYVLKDIKDEDLIRTIKGSVNGFNIIQRSVYNSIKEDYKKTEISLANKEQVEGITKRELEIIKLIVDGYDNKSIAATIHIAEGTVRNTISLILNKLNLKDRTQLAVFAIRNDIV